MKEYSYLHTCTFSYSVCEYSDLQWKQVTEGLPGKNAILKYDWPAQRKWTTTERRSILKLANIDHSLFFFFFLNLTSKYKAMLIVASSGYYVYGALLLNTAVHRTRRDL